MKYALIITVLMAMGVAGCNKSESDQTESPENSSAVAEAAAAEAKRISEAEARDEEPTLVRPPGFFSGGSSRRRRKDDPDEQDTDPDPVTELPEPTPPEPVKRPSPNLVKPGAKAERQLRLSKLYVSNAAAETSAAKRKLLYDKAETILKDIISKYPKTPEATQASKLLTEIKAAK